MQPGDLIVVTLSDPDETFWGFMIQISPSGVIVRGIDVRNFEEFSRQCSSDEEEQLGASTVFFPLHRIQRVMLDEQVGSVPSISMNFTEISGKKPDDVLPEDRDSNIGFTS